MRLRHHYCQLSLVLSENTSSCPRQSRPPDVPTTPLAQETRTYWFNPSTLEAETEFMLVGLVLGLAIYNSVLLDFPLPIALYKKLVGQPPSLRDLSDMEPTVGKSLRELLNYGGAQSNAASSSAPSLILCGEEMWHPGRPAALHCVRAC